LKCSQPNLQLDYRPHPLPSNFNPGAGVGMCLVAAHLYVKGGELPRAHHLRTPVEYAFLDRIDMLLHVPEVHRGQERGIVASKGWDVGAFVAPKDIRALHKQVEQLINRGGHFPGLDHSPSNE
jgi:hypothetical protein